jgi:hypothetical protein
MRALVIDEAAKAKVATMVEYAEQHPFSMDDLLDIHNKQLDPAGYRPGHCVHLDHGFRIVYCIENQVVGRIRHLSVCVDADHALPNPAMVKVIMELIGFKNELERCEVKMEDTSPVRKAVNILEIIK